MKTLKNLLKLNEQLMTNISREIKPKETSLKYIIDFFASTLELSITNFFDESGIWYSDCYKKKKTIDKSYLNCNLRDNKWLTAALLKYQKLDYINEEQLFEYVNNSLFFKEKRHNYELKVVKWQINWMLSGGENWLCDNEFYIFSEECDIIFRNGIKKTLVAIGMDPDVIEEGIEKYSNLWRDKYINIAFSNIFNSLVLICDFNIAYEYGKEKDTSNKIELPKPEKEHEEYWIRNRKHEYYIKNKKSINKYSSEEDLMIPKDELKTFKIKLNKMNKERLNIIENYNKEKKEQKDIKKSKEILSYNNECINNKLDNAIENFFPESGEWLYTCYDKKKEIKKSNLPCHLRNDKWLAKMIRKDQNLSNIKNNKILEYISTSDFFRTKRHAYELKIVKWQIKWMFNGGENWICENDTFRFSEDCVNIFRNGIKDTLIAIGMDSEVIEEGIEKYSSLWRDDFIKLSFINKYNINSNHLYFTTSYLDSLYMKLNEMKTTDKEYLAYWIKLKRHQYYLDNKNSVDNYSLDGDNLLLADEEVEDINNKLEIVNIERLDETKTNKQKKFYFVN